MSDILRDALRGESDEGTVEVLPIGLGTAIELVRGRVTDRIAREIKMFELGQSVLADETRGMIFSSARAELAA